jgi:hypothetical protein
MSVQRCTALALGLIEELLLFHGCDRALHVVAAEVSGWSTRVKPPDLAPALRMAEGAAATEQPMLASLIQAYHGLIEGAAPAGVARTAAEPPAEVDSADHAREVGAVAQQAAAAAVAAAEGAAAAERAAAVEQAAAKAKMEEERRAKRETAKRETVERAKREEDELAAREEAARLKHQQDKVVRKAEEERIARAAAEAAEAEEEIRKAAAERAAAEAAAAAEARAAAQAEEEVRKATEAAAEAELAAAVLALARAEKEASVTEEADAVAADRVAAGRAAEAEREEEARTEADEAEARFAALERSCRQAEESFGSGVLNGPRGEGPTPQNKTEMGSAGGESGSLLGALPALGASRGGGRSLLGDLPGLGPARRGGGGGGGERGRAKTKTEMKSVSFAVAEPVEPVCGGSSKNGIGKGGGGAKSELMRQAHAAKCSGGGKGEGGAESEAAGRGVDGARSLAGVRGLHAGLEETQGAAVDKGVMDAFMRSILDKEGAGRVQAATGEEEDGFTNSAMEREGDGRMAPVVDNEGVGQAAEKAEGKASDRLQAAGPAERLAASDVAVRRDSAAQAERALLQEYDLLGSSEVDLTHTLEALSDDSDAGGAWGSESKQASELKQGTPAPDGTAGGGRTGTAGAGCGRVDKTSAGAVRPVLLEALSDSEDEGGVGFGAELTPGGVKAGMGPEAKAGTGSKAAGDVAARPVMRWEEDEALAGPKQQGGTGGAAPVTSKCEHGHGSWRQGWEGRGVGVKHACLSPYPPSPSACVRLR